MWLAGWGLFVIAGVFLCGLMVGCSKEPTGTYETKFMGATMTVELKADHKCRLSVGDSHGKPESTDGEYTVNGDQITLNLGGDSGADKIVLTNKDGFLEGNYMDASLKFTRK
jgi:hypothetical protein